MLLIVVVLTVFLANTNALNTTPRTDTNTTEELMPKLNSTFVELNKNWRFELIWDENITREALQEAVKPGSTEADLIVYRKKLFMKSQKNFTSMAKKVEKTLVDPLKRFQKYFRVFRWFSYYGCNGIYDTKDSREVPDWVRHILKMQSQLLQMMQNLFTRIAGNKGVTTSSSLRSTPSNPYGDLIRYIPNFVYDVEDDETFETWFKRYGPVIDDRGYALSNDRKRNLIKDKLDKSAYKTCSERVSPLKPKDIRFSITIQNLTKLFGPKRTHIHRRFDCKQSFLWTNSYVPYRDFGNTIKKKKFEEAIMKDVDSDSLKCLVFISGLTDSSHSEMLL
ncbi:Gap-Pol polyprotein [Trichostrongylus colubriformis]|uniref:Gap-Pol polyprotein n=1 Tax=Trichostrongylus colubriformis TaxID=6319 RepID=A0AAN8J3H0_TRICO